MQWLKRGSSSNAAALTLIVPILLLCYSQRTHAQTAVDQFPQVQQLQQRLSQMEKEMQELEQQISSLQQQPPQPQKPPEQSKAERAVQETASEHASAHVPLEQVANAPLPAEPGTALDLYGFTMLDAGYDFATNDPNWFDVVRPTKLNSKPGEFGPDRNVYFSVADLSGGMAGDSQFGAAFKNHRGRSPEESVRSL